MESFDVVIRGGTVIDGTGSPRRTADVAVEGGTIVAIGDLAAASAREEIDASGLVVAPGVVDPHTHYDAQLHWDPYCTNSGTHGSTTVIIGNCGFGFAPCVPEMRERSMGMMERTEQIPLTAMRKGLPWGWQTFPEWMEHLRHQPKGVNVATYLPMNSLMVHVMGLEAAKSRPATDSERAEMRRLLHDAMDAGAIGFAFTWLGPQNNHKDIDGTPMPTDVMDIEEAYNLARVLRERDAGAIQANTDIPLLRERRDVCAELARISGRPVLHNVLQIVGDSNAHNEVLQWLDECSARGLPVYSQSFVNRVWTQFTVESYTSWDFAPVLKEFTDATNSEKMEMAADPAYRKRVEDAIDFSGPVFGGVKYPEFTIISAAGAVGFEDSEGKTIKELAEARGSTVTDTLFDLLTASNLQAEFTHLTRFVTDAKRVAPILRHPRVLAGGSDGGAHVRFVSAGQWSTDLLVWLAREEGVFTLEDMHAKLSALPASVLGLADRGTLEPGKAADIMIYDLDKLGYNYGRYEVLHDLPDGSWRKFVSVRGMRYVLVNGEITMIDGEPTRRYPGALLEARPNLGATVGALSR